MDIQVYVFWLNLNVHFCWYIWGSGIARSQGRLMVSSHRYCTQYSKGIWPIYHSTRSMWEFWLPLLQYLVLSFFFILAILVGVCWHHIMCLICFLLFCIPTSHLSLINHLGHFQVFSSPITVTTISKSLPYSQMSSSTRKPMSFRICHPLPGEFLLQQLWMALEVMLQKNLFLLANYFVFQALRAQLEQTWSWRVRCLP